MVLCRGRKNRLGLYAVGSVVRLEKSDMSITTDQLQRGVGAYQNWKANVGNEASSAFGGNLHDLARRMYEAMADAPRPEEQAQMVQVGWAKLGTESGKLYIREFRNLRAGQNDYYPHALYVADPASASNKGIT
jgi:hypothetical protein